MLFSARVSPPSYSPFTRLTRSSGGRRSAPGGPCFSGWEGRDRASGEPGGTRRRSRTLPVSPRAPAHPMPVDRDPTPCPACRLQRWLCVCAHAPRLAVRTPRLLVVHVNDLGRTSNTSRLLTL